MNDNPQIPVETGHHEYRNRIFSNRYGYEGSYDTPTEIQLTYYNEDGLNVEKIPADEPSFKSLIKENCVNWIEVNGLNNADTVTRLGQEFGLNPLELRSILTSRHVVKIQNWEQRAFLILNSNFFTRTNHMYREHIGIFVQNNVVITFTEKSHNHSIFRNSEKSLRENTMQIRSFGADVLLGFLLNTYFSIQIETVSHLENLLEEIEHTLLGGSNSHKNSAGFSTKIQRCRRAHLDVQKNLMPLKEQFPKLLKTDSGIISEKALPIFDDLSYQLAYAVQTTNNCKEILSSLIDIYASQSDYRTNAIMKHLTVVATMFIPMTFLVGVWGMNFENMPEIKWAHGYAIAWLVLVASGLGTWLFMKKKHWF